MVLESKQRTTLPLSALVGLALVLFSAALAQAQVAGEALWRVENAKPAEPAPLYEGQDSPFPIELPPVAPKSTVVVQKPTVTPQEAASQRQAREAASRMSRIRDLLKDEEAFVPDTSGIQISAIAVGEAGPMALIKGHWFFEGDTIEAPVTTANELMDLMAGLQQVDSNLANIVSKEVENRLSTIGPRKMLVKKIKPDGIVLRRSDGHTDVISFVSKGW